MGYLHLHRKEHVEAREYFKAALAKCEEEGLLGRFYFLRPLIEHGEVITDEQRRLILETDPSLWPDDGLCGLINAGEILHFQSGEYDKSVELFDAARRRGIHDTTSVVYAHLSYRKQGEDVAAEKILASAIKESGTNFRIDASVLFYHLAEMALDAGDLAKTLQIYEKHLLRPQTIIRRFAVRHAQILRRLGDKKRMRMVCLRMLGGQFPAPKTCEDFYYDGFAQHLLGNSERAQYDFERSKQFAPFYSRCE